MAIDYLSISVETKCREALLIFSFIEMIKESLLQIDPAAFLPSLRLRTLVRIRETLPRSANLTSLFSFIDPFLLNSCFGIMSDYS